MLVWTSYLLAQWIVLSSGLILLNKHILSEAGFDFPCTLVLLHMLFCTACACVWRLLDWVSVPLLGGPRAYCARFVPIGLCFAASLSLGNAAYLHISVAFVQMLKASTPVATLVVSFMLGLEQPSWRLTGLIVLISSGVGIACAAQVHPSVLGMLLQLGAIGCEAVRLCLVNLLLTLRGLRLSPVASVLLISPICALCLLPVWATLEASRLLALGSAPWARVGAAALGKGRRASPLHCTCRCTAYHARMRACMRHPMHAVAGASLCTSFALNIATMALIKHTSALTLNVAGVGKDLLLIGYSVVLSGARVCAAQYCGYAVALVGVTAYSRHKRQLQAQAQALADMAEKLGEAEEEAAALEGGVAAEGKDLRDAAGVRARPIGRGLWSGAGARTLSGGEFADVGERKPLLDLAEEEEEEEAGKRDDELDGPITASSMVYYLK